MITELKNLDFFNSLKSSDIELILNNIHFQKKKYKKGETMVYAGNICDSLRILLSGSAHTEMTNLENKTIKIAELKKGQAIAVAFIFGSVNTVPVNVIADEDTEIIIFQKDSVKKMIALNNNILETFLATLSNQIQYLAEKIRFLNFNTLKEKMMYYLTDLSIRTNTDTVILPVTLQRLSGFFGTTRPSLSRTLKELEEDRLIKRVSDKKIKIL